MAEAFPTSIQGEEGICSRIKDVKLILSSQKSDLAERNAFPGVGEADIPNLPKKHNP